MGQGPSGSTVAVTLQVSAANINGTAESNQQIVLPNISPNTVILDDSQSGQGFSETGTWTQWAVQGGGYDNTHSTAARR